MAHKTILILGAGIGGIVTARQLRQHLGNEHRIVVVDKSSVHSFPPSYLWIMTGWRKPSAIQKPLALLEKHGIEFHHASVQSIDIEHHFVVTDLASLFYDYLVVALGAELAPQLVPGMNSSVYSFYTLEHAEQLHRILVTFSAGTIAIVVASLPYKCPPAPYEAALLLESYMKRKTQSTVTIKLFTPEPSPIGAAGQHIGTTLRQLFHHRGIELHTQHRLVGIDTTTKQLTFENSVRTSYDLLILIPPHQTSRVVKEAELTNQNGWIPVDERTLRTTHHNIFALGDVTTIPLANGFTLPKAGVFAHGQGEIVAGNIALELHGRHAIHEFTGTGNCFLETGNGSAGYIQGNFFTKPAPEIILHEPSVKYHWAKVIFEKYWLWRWF